ncbi:aminotransferase-like mobile domain-containing protein, partial [Tanacetum coccineum]
MQPVYQKSNRRKRPAGDEVTGHPRSETAKKYKGISSSTRKGSADFSVDAILDKPATIEGASSSKEDTPEDKNFAHLIHVSEMEKKMKTLARITTILKDVIQNKHTASTAHFTYGTTFSICIEIDQTTIFLQEQNENVIFILNHEVQEHERALNIDCVGVGCFKSGFVYQLTAKSMETCLSLRSVPEIYTEWSKDTPRKCNLTVPSGFADYNGLLSLFVYIKKKVIPSEFEEEMKEVSIEFEHNLDGRPKARLP